MRQLLYDLITFVYRMHERLLTLNDSYELFLDDKQLHFLVIGVIGMVLVLIIHPLFTLLAKKDHILVISWVYVFTVILVLTFAIEIGQGYSGTGSMEPGDIISGVAGFLLMFLVFAIIRAIIKGFAGLFRKLDERG